MSLVDKALSRRLKSTRWHQLNFVQDIRLLFLSCLLANHPLVQQVVRRSFTNKYKLYRVRGRFRINSVHLVAFPLPVVDKSKATSTRVQDELVSEKVQVKGKGVGTIYGEEVMKISSIFHWIFTPNCSKESRSMSSNWLNHYGRWVELWSTTN